MMKSRACLDIATLLFAIVTGSCSQKTNDDNVVARLKDASTTGDVELAADNTGVYIAYSDTTHIKRLAKLSNGAATTLWKAPPGTITLVGPLLDKEALYFDFVKEMGGDANVIRLPRAGGPPTTLTSESLILNLSLDDTYLYWIGSGIKRIPKLGGASETLVKDESVELTSRLALDEQNIYFAAKGAIERVAKSGGTTEVLAKDLKAEVYEMAAHDGTVWWSETSLPVVYKIKPGGTISTIPLEPNSIVQALAWSDGVLVVDMANKKLLRIDDNDQVTTLEQLDGPPEALAVNGQTVYVALTPLHSPLVVRRYELRR